MGRGLVNVWPTVCGGVFVSGAEGTFTPKWEEGRLCCGWSARLHRAGAVVPSGRRNQQAASNKQRPALPGGPLPARTLGSKAGLSSRGWLPLGGRH